MKTIVLIALAATLVPVLLRAEAAYTVLRVCEDKHVLRTSDGMEGGHIEYLVLEPSTQHVAAAIVTGGVVGTRFVAVPFVVMEFNSDREIMLTGITRERMVSAPVIEQPLIVSNHFDSALLERANHHFEIRTTAGIREDDQTRSGTLAGGAIPGGRTERGPAATPGSQPGEKMPVDAPATSQRQRTATDSGSKRPGQNPPGIAEKLPGDEGQGKSVDQRNSERVTEPQEGRRKDAEQDASEQQRQKQQPAAPVRDKAQPLKNQAERKAPADKEAPAQPGDREDKKPEADDSRQ